MNEFFILGLPRSRTAWLANFFTYDGLFCYHEAINGCGNMDEYIEKIKGKGDSDTALALFDFEKYFPARKIIIIDSGIGAAVEFGKQQGHDITEIMKIEKTRLDNILGLHVELEEIDDRLPEMWSHITNRPYDKTRADMLVNMDIQVKSMDHIDMKSMKKFIEASDGYIP